MITYSLLVLSTHASRTRDLVATCRDGGLINSLLRQLSGCMGVSVLVSEQTEAEILLIIFFSSLELATESTKSPMGVFLLGLLERISNRCWNLGLFSFPSQDFAVSGDFESVNQVPLV